MEPDLAQLRASRVWPGAGIGRELAHRGAKQIPVLTTGQRRGVILKQASSWPEQWLIAPAVLAISRFSEDRQIPATWLRWAGFALAGWAGALLLMGGATSPLFRFWAGLFLCAGQFLFSAWLRSPAAGRQNWLRDSVPVFAIVLFAACGEIHASAAIAGSLWLWPAGLAAIVAVAIQTSAYTGIRRQYIRGAGATEAPAEEHPIELQIRAREAELRGRPDEARLWRVYRDFQIWQRWFLPCEPAGSADAFWALNRRRMMLWALFAPDTLCTAAALTNIASAFVPLALPAFIGLISGPGMVMLLLLRLAGWKSRPLPR